MRLKEIKPGMEIRCENDEEKKLLFEEAERLGYVWYGTKGKPTERSVHDIGDTIHFYDAGTNSFSADYKHITHSCQICNTEFSDLIIPDQELSAEEALLAYDKMCNENYCCNDCPIYGVLWHECAKRMDGHISEIVDAIKKWKADHEKKEPEAVKKEPKIETVDICRIIEIQPDGRKRCVHEEDMNNPDRTIGEKSYLLDVEEILRRYCMEHEGEFIAVHEVVSRVKAVE